MKDICFQCANFSNLDNKCTSHKKKVNPYDNICGQFLKCLDMNKFLYAKIMKLKDRHNSQN